MRTRSTQTYQVILSNVDSCNRATLGILCGNCFYLGLLALAVKEVQHAGALWSSIHIFEFRSPLLVGIFARTLQAGAARCWLGNSGAEGTGLGSC
eukprot:894438-Amphidinium_carterae.1